ncbi:hypothetical protein [Hahella ganghwensis]|uniref:hypothetical protein n=1 Tax=Hahella ganghwensis TaxID=286420 RepID=UPI00035E2AD9|nr:hypothetical protein [Hahella ganghwensis]
MLNLRFSVVFFCAAYAVSAQADVGYVFRLVMCDSEKRVFHTRDVVIWNIDSLLFPGFYSSHETEFSAQAEALEKTIPEVGVTKEDEKTLARIEDLYKQHKTIVAARNWVDHEEALKQIEDAYGLYSFGAKWGRYSPEPIVCDLGSVDIMIEADKWQSDFFNNDVYYRGDAQLTVVHSRSGKRQTYFPALEGMLTLRADTESGILIEYCEDTDSCGEEWEYHGAENPDGSVSMPEQLRQQIDAYIP